LLSALAAASLEADIEQCPDDDETSMLQTSPKIKETQHTLARWASGMLPGQRNQTEWKYPEGSEYKEYEWSFYHGGQVANTCVLQDGANELAHDSDYNATLAERYRSEGKIKPDGVPSLNYVHIPKTGGDSFLLASKILGPYGMSYSNKVVSAKIVPAGLKTPSNCFFAQLPAVEVDRLSPGMAETVYGGSEIFCAVRDPYARAISGACHMSTYIDFPLFEHGLDSALRFWLEQYLHGGNQRVGTCFWIPQVDYMKGPNGCKHVLDFDHLEEDYDNLMAKYGFDELKMFPPNATHGCKTGCNETKTDLSPETIKLMETIYAEDI